MTKPQTHRVKIGSSSLNFSDQEVTGSFVKRNGELYYKVGHVNRMDPFFMSIVSHDEHWMFIGSNGALTAGRKNEEHALFPYSTDDKILEAEGKVGSLTLIRVHAGEELILWKPFSKDYAGVYALEQNLYKSQWGNEVVFEEINHDLGLSFTYTWQFSSKYGFVKKSQLLNLTDKEITLEVMDLVQDLMPFGISSALQQQRSNLGNAYKRNELHEGTGLGVFALSSLIVDRAEPSEALKATVAWHTGIVADAVFLSSLQTHAFAIGKSIETEKDIKGTIGSYGIKASLGLASQEKKEWFFCLDIDQTPAQVHNLIAELTKAKDLILPILHADLAKGTEELKKIVAKSDGLQLTADQASVSRHYSNVLFNVMRGGIFEDDYSVDKQDFLHYVKEINKPLMQDHAAFFDSLVARENYQALISKAKAIGSSDLIRVCMEYLPLSFSRRHGDPSRPWNKFSIDLKNPDGSKRRAYAGNWRDIFQNWEALAVSFPQFLEGMICKFLNASTMDGYNPYRISCNGVDWEVIEPDDPWSYIGYWGDHQIIYLLKLLELAKKHQVLSFKELAPKEWFVFANVPYRIRSFEEIVKDSQDTVIFDEALEHRIQQRFASMGGDGKLVPAKNGTILKSSFLEKLFIPWLTKLGNLVPDAGIWMNTQRPEWNDANNALVGNGTSMVTLYYMYRFTKFMETWIQEELSGEIQFHEEVEAWMQGMYEVLKSHEGQLNQGFDANTRYAFVKALGLLSERYREQTYAGLSEKKSSVSTDQLVAILKLTKEYLRKSIEHNKREDGLYHAYNLIDCKKGAIQVDYLYEMLEGQVSILSSGYLEASEAVELLEQMKKSAIYREDQYSYLLYPNRTLAGFLGKSSVPTTTVQKNPLLAAMIAKGDTRIIDQDAQGNCFFNSEFNNVKALRTIYDAVKADYPSTTDEVLEEVEGIYESVFNHKAFTGRSGTFFAFEGLGSIYWHMVSKLLLAVSEILAEDTPMDPVVRGKLIDNYYEIRAGIGINKTPTVYGAIPTDPYSHTPSHRGAQQPGMTGQVKEDILNRWAELGVGVVDGCIQLNPTFLAAHEWLKTPQEFSYLDLNGEFKVLPLEKDSLGFTYCQVPVKYVKGSKNLIQVIGENSLILEKIEGNKLSAAMSSEIFNRTGKIKLLYFTVAG
ncbi:hypothetical protein [Mongoliitalea lutea]|uniref:Cellobiose phosphorylase n=1 Tax=Mongoliitalea lutea TaxID=849756 RepID=A0A8J3CTK2_9BACT|nr:hypothetical protein [Mongoliitalea lutea]GHB25347.1 hypothetical protein GCM10008106_02640 [Mongoliitalea lutea]